MREPGKAWFVRAKHADGSDHHYFAIANTRRGACACVKAEGATRVVSCNLMRHPGIAWEMRPQQEGR